jgi:hypothetical protein
MVLCAGEFFFRDLAGKKIKVIPFYCYSGMGYPAWSKIYIHLIDLPMSMP